MIVKIALAILALLLTFQVLARLAKKVFHAAFPAPAFIGRFLNSRFRRMMQPPDKVLRDSGVQADMSVLDLGCGSGALTTFLARAVGEAGCVFALDIQLNMLRQLQRKLARAEHRDIHNIQPVRASAYELPFHDDSLDLVIVVAVLQEVPDPSRALREIRRILKPGGIVAVSELLPDPDYPLRSTTIRLGREAGFDLDDALGSFFSYTVRFKKP